MQMAGVSGQGESQVLRVLLQAASKQWQVAAPAAALHGSASGQVCSRRRHASCAVPAQALSERAAFASLLAPGAAAGGRRQAFLLVRAVLGGIGALRAGQAIYNGTLCGAAARLEVQS